jgi:kynurenine formamidase
MCNACIIENVKASMLSRRSLFKSAVAAGAVSAAALAAPKLALAQSAGKVVDLTHVFDPAFPTFDGKPGIEAEKILDFKKDGYTIFKLTIFEHTGTHIDAPLHFSENGTSVDALEPQRLVCPLCIIDIKAKAGEDANSMVMKADIDAWISANGEIPAGACVAMNSGWAARVGQADYRTNAEGAFAFPGFSKEATDMLAELNVAAIGVDTLSLDPGNSKDFAVHNSWLPSGHYGIENLNALDELPAKGATLFVGAPKHKGGTGGPARVMAVM